EGLGASLQSALTDYRVRAILLDVDSPGGQVDGMLDLADQILAARAKMPVWSVANSVAASAAYALAASAEKLYLPRLAQVGSIGAGMIPIDQSAPDQARGLKYSAGFSGPRKVDGWGPAELSGQARAGVQGPRRPLPRRALRSCRPPGPHERQGRACDRSRRVFRHRRCRSQARRWHPHLR